MHAYRFKLTFEEQDGFSREIELLSGQRFDDFHRAITNELGLDPGMLASFFICDHKFRKKQEIALVNMQEEAEEENSEQAGLPLMGESRISDFIDDPHQKLMYVYDYLNYWTFYIELKRIMPADLKKAYPHFHRKEGDVPRELTATPKQIPGVERLNDFPYPAEEDGYSPEDLEQFDQEDHFSGEGREPDTPSFDDEE